MKILVAMPQGEIRDLFLPPANIERLQELGEVKVNPMCRHYTREELSELLREVDAVVTGWGCEAIGKEVLGDGRYPGIVAHTGGTVAPYTDEETFYKGIHVVSANNLYAKSVAEGTLAYMLAGMRRIPYWTRKMYSGGWQEPGYRNYGLFGKRVGLTGYGEITRNLIPLLHVFETEILLYSGHMTEEECEKIGVKKASLEEIFSTCDIVSVHNSSTKANRNLVDDRLLKMLKKDALFINTSRGAVIDEQALARRLKEGDFTAVLDVYQREPLAEESPLRGLDNVYLMPHMGGPTTDLYAKCAAAVIEDIRRFRDGEPLLHEIRPDTVKHMTQSM